MLDFSSAKLFLSYIIHMISLILSHNHHFSWWFGLALIRTGYMLAQTGGYGLKISRTNS